VDCTFIACFAFSARIMRIAFIKRIAFMAIPNNAHTIRGSAPELPALGS
jgi:hypothetical protein